MNTVLTNADRTLLKSVTLIGVSLLLFFTIVTRSPYFFGLLGAFGVLVLFILRFDIVFPVLLILRSGLDSFTDFGVDIGPMNLNLAAGLSIFIDICGVIYFAGLLISKKPVPLNSVIKSFGWWLFSLLFWVWLSHHHFGFEGLGAVREWIRLFSILMIYVLSLQLARLKGYNYLVTCVMISQAIPLSVALYDIFLLGTESRIGATFSHPNTFALYLILCIGLTFWKIKFSAQKKAWFLLLALELFLLWNTFSIGGSISFGVFGTLLIIKESWKRTRYVIIIVAMFIILLAGLSFSDLGQRRFHEIEQTPTLHQIIKDEISTNSLSWRIVNWKNLLREWRDRPFLGYGLDTCLRFVNPWRNEAHNDYLRYLVEIGLLGLAGYLLFIRTIALHIWAKYRAPIADQEKYLVLVVFAIFLAWVAGALWDNHITATAFQFYFWALLAAI